MPIANKDVATRSHNNDYQNAGNRDAEFTGPIRVRNASGALPTLPAAASAAQIEAFLREVFILTA